MLIVTQTISHLTILNRRSAETARRIQHQTTALYSLSRQLANTRGTNNLLEIGCKFIANAFNCDVLALLLKEHLLAITYSTSALNTLSPKEEGVVQWVYDLGQKAGYGTDTLSSSTAIFFPLIASKSTVGVLRIQPKNSELLSPEQVRLIEACTHQLALAIEVDILQNQTSK
jgi:two-component system sensor histidine kinase KdpD